MSSHEKEFPIGCRVFAVGKRDKDSWSGRVVGYTELSQRNRPELPMQPALKVLKDGKRRGTRGAVQTMLVKYASRDDTVVDPLSLLTREQVLKAVRLIDGDGHIIFKREALERCGWPEAAVEQACEIIEGDDSGKNSIFGKDGVMIAKLYGWHGLKVLQDLARILGIEQPDLLGRGFLARELTSLIIKHYAEKEVVA